MKVNDIVRLVKHTDEHSRGVLDQKYKIAEIKKTELKLCSIDNNDYCFYTSPYNVAQDILVSIPDWVESDTINIEIDTESFADKLEEAANSIIELLKTKNKAYGNTALNPVNIFSKLNATEAIRSRIDDKLSRIANKGINDQTEDTVDDLIGYLLLLKMSL
jgi:hypothetical protein|tara:strand:- start:396 stop:878 length:483 start_codon:yes stop_codon:yes gene_type:complete